MPISRPRSLVVTQSVIPDYRLSFFEALVEAIPQALIQSGDEYFSEAISTVEGAWRFTSRLRNTFFLGKRILWQWGGVWQAARAGTWIFEMNPRILSSWFILAVRSLTNRPSIGWGHAWPRSGQDSGTSWLRSLMRNRCSALLVYAFRQREELIESGVHIPIHVAANAIYSRDVMRPSRSSGACDVLYVGRMIAEKKVMLLLEGFHLALPSLPPQSRLVLVGEGPEVEPIKRAATEFGIIDRVQFLGHVADAERLSAIYASSLFSTSPGYAGLSLTQSFGFGVPALIARSEPHSPEIEAAKEGENALFFESNSPEALSSALVAMFSDPGRWLEAAERISADCRARYSVESMVEAFVEATSSVRS